MVDGDAPTGDTEKTVVLPTRSSGTCRSPTSVSPPVSLILRSDSNIAPSAATLLSPALPLTAPVSRSDPITLTARVPGPDPRSSPRGLGAGGRGTTLPGTNLRIAAQLVAAIVSRVRRHRPPVRALSFELSQRRGSVAADRFTLFALGHCETRKTTH